MFRNALAIQEQQSPGSLGVAASHYEIGCILLNRGDHLHGAFGSLQEALMIRERLAPGSDLCATSYNSIGSLLTRTGDLDGSLQQFEKAVAIRNRMDMSRGDSIPLEATYSNIGVVFHQQGDLDNAIQYRMKALILARETQQEEENDSSSSASGVAGVSYHNIASVLQDQGDLTGALEFFQKALSTRNERRLLSDDVMPPVEEAEAATLHNSIGWIMKEVDDDIDGALKHFEIALSINKRVSPCSLAAATSFNNVASVLHEMSDLDGALTHLRRALAIREQILVASRKEEDAMTLAKSYDNNIGTVLKDQNDSVGALSFVRPWRYNRNWRLIH